MLVVADTTPLISLIKIKRLSILERLFRQVLVPEAVYNELTTNTSFVEESRQFAECGFIQRVSSIDSRYVKLLRETTGLDLGESEAIAYADSEGADVLLIDEIKGRRIARSMGLPIMGTIGVLLASFQDGVSTAVDVEKDLINLKQNNRYISNELFQYALRKIHMNADDTEGA